jgi:hypothetical protein
MAQAGRELAPPLPVVNLRVLSLNSVIGFRDSTLPARLSDENFPLKII